MHGPFGASSQHSKVEPGTSEVNVKVAEWLSLGSSGPVRTIPTGGWETNHS